MSVLIMISGEDWGLETFGADLKLVKQLPSAHVWTVVDSGDSADQWILPGIHTVNRICFLVSKVPHNWRELEFQIPYRGYSLTRLGLLRQLNKISKWMSSNEVASNQDEPSQEIEAKG